MPPVKLELTLLQQSTLLVTVETGSPCVLPPSSNQAAAHSALVGELKELLRDDIVDGLVVALKGDLSCETLREVASWFPRRLNGGRIAVVCESELKGRAFASTLTVPLLPRPVRVFPSSSLTDAVTWASQNGFRPTLELASRTRKVRTNVGVTTSQTLRIPNNNRSWRAHALERRQLAFGIETN
jgi:hypothetical protein